MKNTLLILAACLLPKLLNLFEYIIVFETLPSLSETLDLFNLRANKALGQNFLLDLNITRKIAREGKASSGHTIVEIGPGPGGLTRALFLEGATQVIAIEKDPRFIAALAPIQAEIGTQLQVIEADATKFDITTLSPLPLKIIANLPYNVGTLLLINWLGQLDAIHSMTLLFQKEVAERMGAKPNTKAYGRLSVLAQLTCQVKMLFDIPPQAFTPAPKVVSTLIELTPRTDRPSADILEKVKNLTMLAFGQRRKMLRSSLKPLLQNKPDLLEKLGIDGNLRGEVLSPAQYLKMAEML